MEDLAFARDVAHEPITHAKTLFELLLRADENVDRKAGMTLQVNLCCLLMMLLPIAWHDHQKIDIGIGLGIAARVRTEKDDFFRAEFADDFVCQSLNLAV